MGNSTNDYINGFAGPSVYSYPYNGTVKNSFYSGIGPTSLSTSAAGCYLNNKLYIVIQGSGNRFIAIYSSGDITSWDGSSNLAITQVPSTVPNAITSTNVYNSITRQCSGFITPYGNNVLFFTTSGGIYKYTISPPKGKARLLILHFLIIFYAVKSAFEMLKGVKKTVKY